MIYIWLDFSYSTGKYITKLGSVYADEGGINVHVIEIISHPKYDRSTFDFDVSVLRLAQTLTFTRYIKPIPLAKRMVEPLTGTISVISGYGLTSVSFT